MYSIEQVWDLKQVKPGMLYIFNNILSIITRIDISDDDYLAHIHLYYGGDTVESREYTLVVDMIKLPEPLPIYKVIKI